MARNPLRGWTGLLIAALPLVFTAIGVVFLAEAVQFRQHALQTQGEVVDLILDTSGDGLSYTPVVEYRALDGATYQGRTHVSSSSYNYRKGERVRILYDPANTGEVRIDSFFSLYGLGAIFAGAGGVFLLVLAIMRARMGGPAVRDRTAHARKRQRPASAEGRGGTTDPSRYGHSHAPKPPPEPTVRRMR